MGGDQDHEAKDIRQDQAGHVGGLVAGWGQKVMEHMSLGWGGVHIKCL